MNILITVDKNYIHPLTVMLKSFARNGSIADSSHEIYILSRSLDDGDIRLIRETVDEPTLHFHYIHADHPIIEEAPTSRRYPLEMYDRIFAARYLPEDLDRILYLDPDMIILDSLDELYALDLGKNYYAAASHVGRLGSKFNELRIDGEDGMLYINTGVLLMNLSLLRREQETQPVLNYIENHPFGLLLPDQDIICALYGTRIHRIDPYIYNMTERMLNHYSLRKDTVIDFEWVRENSSVVHYVGRNKPWKHYIGELNVFYEKYDRMVESDRLRRTEKA